MGRDMNSQLTFGCHKSERNVKWGSLYLMSLAANACHRHWLNICFYCDCREL